MRVVGLPLRCAVACIFLATALWCLWVRQFHPLMIVFAVPYAITGGLLFGLLMGAIPNPAFVRIQDSSRWNRVILPIALGIVAGVGACILYGTFGRWMSWGSTAAFVSAGFQCGLLIDNKVLVLCTVIGMICGPILWFLGARARISVSPAVEAVDREAGVER